MKLIGVDDVIALLTNHHCISNRNIKTAIESDYPDAVMTDMIVENKTSYGTFQANEAEYCYKVENNQLRIQRRN